MLRSMNLEDKVTTPLSTYHTMEKNHKPLGEYLLVLPSMKLIFFIFDNTVNKVNGASVSDV